MARIKPCKYKNKYLESESEGTYVLCSSSEKIMERYSFKWKYF